MYEMPNLQIPQIDMNIAKEAYENRQKLLSAADAYNHQAEIIAKNLLGQIVAYQSQLPQEQDVSLVIANYGCPKTLYVSGIGYIGNTLLRFSGKNIDGSPSVLIQHVSQLNFGISVCQAENHKHRPIGFHPDEN